jgi:hypothetical protein
VQGGSGYACAGAGDPSIFAGRGRAVVRMRSRSLALVEDAQVELAELHGVGNDIHREKRVDNVSLAGEIGVGMLSAPCTRRRAGARVAVPRRGAPDDESGLVEGHGEHVVQDERESLGGRQLVEYDEQREAERSIRWATPRRWPRFSSNRSASQSRSSIGHIPRRLPSHL